MAGEGEGEGRGGGKGSQENGGNDGMGRWEDGKVGWEEEADV